MQKPYHARRGGDRPRPNDYPRKDSSSRGGQSSSKPVLANALRLKNFKALADKVPVENLSVALDLPLSRVKQLLDGHNFGEETAFFIEHTLALSPGFLDQLNPILSEEVVNRLNSPELFAQEEEHEEHPEVAAPKAPSAAPSTDLAPATVPTPSAVAPAMPVAVAAEPVVPAKRAPLITVKKRKILAEHKPEAEALAGEAGSTENKEKSMVAAQTPAPAAAPSAEAAELQLREIRRENLALITAYTGAKSQLARLTGMSPANISHRLHGNKLFDDETASFFCEKLGLPEGWFNAPHTPADVPPSVFQLLSNAPAAPVVTKPAAPASAPAAAPKRRTRTKAELPAPSGASLPSLKSGVLSSEAQAAAPAAPGRGPRRRTATPAPVAAAPAAVVTAPAPAPAPAAPAVAAVPAPTPAPEVAAPAPAPAVASVMTMVAQPGEIGPVAEALLKTLALKAREGTFTESAALKLLTEVLSG